MKYLLTIALFLGMLFTCGNADAHDYRIVYGNRVYYPYIVYPRYYVYPQGFNFSVNGPRLNLQFYNYQYPSQYYHRPNRLPGSHYFPPTPHPSNNWSR